MAPNNDNAVGTSPNSIFVTQKDYVGLGPVDLVFDVRDTGGVTEYFVMEGVQNSTGLDWNGYRIELGFGEGAGFVKSTSGDGLDFDAPDFDSDFDFNPGGFFFPTVSVTEDDILATGGVQPNGAFAGNFLFHVDVPDGISSFTIRQAPIGIPEPAALAASLLAIVVGVARRR
ncbi:MAG: choice-of-anchor F family protein [Planctomycetota bacterium]